MKIKDIYQAQERLNSFLPKTPLLNSFILKKLLNKNIYLKLETQLPTGSFKPRPAFNSILANLDSAKKQGVIASSSGNFAQAVAYAAKQMDINALIVMTETTSPFKIERTKKLGADVFLCGSSHQERQDTTLRLQKETGRFLLHPYDSLDTIAGDGTIGLELHEVLGNQLNDFTILVPVSGGGLIAGIAFTLKKLHPGCKVIAIQSDVNGALKKSMQENKVVTVPPFKTIADALVATSPGEIPFSIIKEYVDDCILVTENSIKEATEFLIQEHKLVVEPAGATTLAALFTNQVNSENIVCVISGGNINLI